MTRADKYERLYRQGYGVCGPPFRELEAFFETHVPSGASVLDLGCGQGRDALFIARLGHRVLGVDLSPTGVGQMLSEARREGLAVEGVVCDLVVYEPPDAYEVVVLDRVLHMLANDDDRRAVLARACRHTRAGGFLLIADMAKHIPLFREVIVARQASWRELVARKGFLFLQKGGSGPARSGV